MDKTYKQIIQDLSKFFRERETEASHKTEENSKLKGPESEKSEKEMFSKLAATQEQFKALMGLLSSQDRSSKFYPHDHIQVIQRLIKTIQNINKRKAISHKLTKNIQALLTKTEAFPKEAKNVIQNYLKKQGSCGCMGGGDEELVKSVLTTLTVLYQLQASWRMVYELEGKDSNHIYITHPFNEKEFVFIKRILESNWPANKPHEQKEKEIKYITKQADRLKNAYQFLLGFNQEANPIRAIQIMEEEAKKGNGQAHCNLGRLYTQGVYIPNNPQNLRKGIQHFEEAVILKSRQAGFFLGQFFLQNPQSSGKKSRRQQLQAVKRLFEESAKLDSPQALVQLGSLYLEGYFSEAEKDNYRVAVDTQKAFQYFSKAYEQSKSPSAANGLGLYYLNRSKKTLDQKEKAKAFEHFNWAYHNGNIKGLFNTGVCLMEGIGTKQDHEEAFKCFKAGAIRRDQDCVYKYTMFLVNLFALYKQQYVSQFCHAFTLLNEICFKTSYQLKIHYYIGMFYQHGYGVAKDLQIALECYEKALSYGPCLNRLGTIFLRGLGVTQDVAKAIEYFEKSAETGCSEGMVSLANLLLYNEEDKEPGSKINRAVQLLQAAVEKNNLEAYVQLAVLYYNGEVLRQDEEQAAKLLQRAAELGSEKATEYLSAMGFQTPQQKQNKVVNLNFQVSTPVIQDFSKASKLKLNK